MTVAGARGRRRRKNQLGVALALPQRSLGIQRERVLGSALLERLAVANYTTDDEVVEVGLELAADAADIFEVRGFPREHRGTLEETAVRHARSRFAPPVAMAWSA